MKIMFTVLTPVLLSVLKFLLSLAAVGTFLSLAVGAAYQLVSLTNPIPSEANPWIVGVLFGMGFFSCGISMLFIGLFFSFESRKSEPVFGHK